MSDSQGGLVSNISLRFADSFAFSDINIGAKLADTEDHFVERKSRTDKGGWIRTTVAFANSAPIGYPALLFVGVTDDGTITDNGNVADLMKSYSDTVAERCYPPIYTMPTVFTNEGRSCLAVVVPGSEARPHFAGRSYVRDGTQTKDASEDQFARLIDQRNSKARMILEWKGKSVTHQFILNRGTHTAAKYSNSAIVEDCNQFFVTLSIGSPKTTRSIPLAWIELSFDHDPHNPKLMIVGQD